MLRSVYSPSLQNPKVLGGEGSIQLLVVHHISFAFQHQADPAIPKSTSLARNPFHFFADIGVVRRTVTPDGLGGDDRPTYTPNNA